MVTALTNADLDQQLRDAASKTAATFLDFADLAAQAIERKVHESFGYLSEEKYFEERVGVGYRTLRRWLQARAGVQRLPEEDRPEARIKLAHLGVHKAASLAPVLGKVDVDWRDEVAFAEQATTSAVQARASDLTGARPRGMPEEPGGRFLRFLVNQVPPSRADFVERVMNRLMKVADIKHPVAAFLVMVDITNRDLAAQGQGVEEDAEKER